MRKEMEPADSSDELLVAEEVAQLLRLKSATVYEAAADGRLPCVRLWKGARKAVVRFKRSDIERIIRERTIDSRTGQG